MVLFKKKKGVGGDFLFKARRAHKSKKAGNRDQGQINDKSPASLLKGVDPRFAEPVKRADGGMERAARPTKGGKKKRTHSTITVVER